MLGAVGIIKLLTVWQRRLSMHRYNFNTHKMIGAHKGRHKVYGNLKKEIIISDYRIIFFEFLLEIEQMDHCLCFILLQDKWRKEANVWIPIFQASNELQSGLMVLKKYFINIY